MSVVLMEEEDSYSGGGGEGPTSSSSTSAGLEQYHQRESTMRKLSSVCEIEEEEEEEEKGSRELFEISGGRSWPMASIKEEGGGGGGSPFSLDFHGGDDMVYVAVDHQSAADASFDALVWTLNHAVGPSTLVFLVHVFAELRFIPTPLGKLPITQANPEQKEIYLIQERSRRREYLQKFLDICSASKVKVDTILIESDMEAKALLDLIPILNIKKLVLGTSKSNLRRLRSRRGSGTADRVLQSAPEFCEVKIICEGKEVGVDISLTEASSPRSNVAASPRAPPPPPPHEGQPNDSFRCTCFKPKVTT